jgi:hypothetical protein
MSNNFQPNDAEIELLRHLCGGGTIGPRTKEELTVFQTKTGQKARAHLEELGLIADNRNVFHLTPAGRKECHKVH